MHTLTTKSSSRKLVLSCLYAFIPMFALAFLGLRIAVATWLFFEGILLLTMCFCLPLAARNRWEITFTDNNLHLKNLGNRQAYYFENVGTHELVLKQSKSQKAKNCCDLQIVGTSFGIYDVQDYAALSAYIQAHCG